MKPLFVLTFCLAAISVRGAASIDAVIIAAMKLSEQPNYSWISTVTDDARTYHIEGKTMDGSCTWVRLPLVKSISERLGREAETDVEAIFLGKDECVIRTDTGWRSLRELPRHHREARGDYPGWVPRSRGAHRGTFGMPVLAAHPMTRKSAPGHRYSNAQFGVSHPHEELAIIVSSYTHMQRDGDVVSGTLSDLGAQLLLVRDDQEEISPVAAAGTFQLQLANGLVVKYAVQLEGILNVGRTKVHVQQTAITLLRGVGATSFEVPEQVRVKLAD